MKFPAIIEAKLKSSPALTALVAITASNFASWLEQSKTPFFPEYTDHNLTHVEAVLYTAMEIANADGLDLLTPHDAAVLCIGVCLHDCAMHLTEDGFLALIKDDCRWTGVAGFDSNSWSDLWFAFLAEARRFDGRKLQSLFGDTTPISRPDDNPINWTMRDRLLIGEFLRRHHARLAHEIALHGVPATEGSAFELFDPRKNFETADLAGLLARSHGLPLRGSLDYLRTKYDVREFNGVHAVYLMVMLRIADFLQIQSGRAPSQILDLRKLHSPVSQGEWTVHASIRNITTESEDPEAIYVDARPKEVKTFLRVREWLNGIQSELDLSWAVLGEIYGRYNLSKLTLTLRRVRSNIDNISSFERTVDFVPKQVAFESAGADLLKLLVGPLYGHEPGIGVRELIQNASDAVWELEDFILNKGVLDDASRIQQEADIVILIDVDNDKRPTKLTISDRGIGMNEDVITNYFLKAGASFRNSELWKLSHENEEGHSDILRSGRFGIGALAAFLIGDQIEVITRHAGQREDGGLRFVAHLDDEFLNLTRCRCQIGTVISVRIPESMRDKAGELFGYVSSYFGTNAERKNLGDYEGLNYYRLSKPSLLVEIPAYNLKMSYQPTLPSVGDDFTFPWRSFGKAGYRNLHWTYDGLRSIHCNGILVNERYERGPELNYVEDVSVRSRSLYWRPQFRQPAISVFDPDAILPLDLQRKNVVGGVDCFEPELSEAVAYDLMAYALVAAPEAAATQNDSSWLFGRYEGISNRGLFSTATFESYPLWIVGKEGFTLNDPRVISLMECETILCAFNNGRDNHLLAAEHISSLEQRAIIMSVGNFGSLNAIKSCLAHVLRHKGFVPFAHRSPIESVGHRIIFAKSAIDRVLKGKVLGAGLKRIIESTPVEKSNKNWIMYRVGECPSQPTNNSFVKILQRNSDSSALGYAEAYIDKRLTDIGGAGTMHIANKWAELFAGNLIPWSRLERRKKFAELFEKLDSYIKHHERAVIQTQVEN